MPTTGYASQHKSLRWDLDMLGNWNSLVRDADEDGSFTDLEGDNHTDGRRHNAANEIESNGLVSDPNFDREVISGGSPAASRYFQHRYDHAGNMTDQRSAAAVPVGSALMAGFRMGYDAWNRLVTTEYTSPLGASDVSAYTYNALGWRTSKTADATKGAYDGVMEQKRVFVYDASWRIIEEHVDVDFDTNPGADWVSQHFWGLRYIDDLVAKRVDRDADGDWRDSAASQWYFITDSQFSVVAVLDHAKSLYDRIEYDAYGNARHRFGGDVDGNGWYQVITDLSKLGGEHSIGDPGYHADYDVDFDGNAFFGSVPNDNLRLAAMGLQNLPALRAGWISDPRATSTGPDNSIGYCGYVFNPERDDYTVRFRVYAPELGRWRTRDPIGYVDGTNLYQYAASSPVVFADPSGLTISVSGNRNEKKKILDALNEMCPGGEFEMDSDGSIKSKDPHFSDCDKADPDEENPELCNCLRKALASENDFHIRPAKRKSDGLGGGYHNNDYFNTNTNEVFIGKGFKRDQSYPGYYDDENVNEGKRPREQNKVPWNAATALAHELCAHGVDGLRHPTDGTEYTPTDPVIERENVYRRELGPDYGVRTGS